MSKGENFIHIKFEYEEGMYAKREILSSELSLVSIMKSLSRYTILRSAELKLKAKFYREIKKTLSDTRKLESNLPDIELPKKIKYLQNNPHEKIREPQERVLEIKGKNEAGLEDQLREIQRKLQSLSH